MSTETISTVLGFVFLVLLLVLMRRTRTEQPKVWSFIRFGSSSLITDTTPPWLALFLLVFTWFGNAAVSALFWVLSIGSKEVGYAILFVNAGSIAWSLKQFTENRRAEAIRNLQWVIPIAVCLVVTYWLIQSYLS